MVLVVMTIPIVGFTAKFNDIHIQTKMCVALDRPAMNFCCLLRVALSNLIFLRPCLEFVAVGHSSEYGLRKGRVQPLEHGSLSV